mgnify:CR=1 FL=1
MRAQLSFEYYFSLIVFVIFISSLFFKMITIVPVYSDEINAQQLRSEAYQISEILINDVGYPGNWDKVDISEVKRLGLSDETKNKTNVISLSKLTAFNNLYQSDYKKVLELLGIKDGFAIKLKPSLPVISPSLDNMPPLPSATGISTEIKRIVALDSSSFEELTVQMWEK